MKNTEALQTLAIKQIIKKNKISNKRLAEIWCIVNSWKVPKEFEHLLRNHAPGNTNPEASQLMKFITLKLGINKCLEEWDNENANWRSKNEI
jgi:hypothetical protein